MPRKSSIHFKPVSNVRFAVSHSERTDLSEPAYLLPKEHQLDNIVVTGSLSENDLSALFIQQKEGMTGQAKARGSSPFWEGVVVLPNTNGQEQSTNLLAWKKEYERATGHKVLHMSVHLDEGYLDALGKPQYNPHAHVILTRMDSKNRVINLDRKQLAQVQDLTATTLQMERGSTLAERQGKRGRQHVPHREFRVQADEKRLVLEKPKADLVRLQKLSKEWSDADLAKVKDLQARLDGEPARLEAALKAQEAQLKEQYRLDREALKASGEATQQDYQQLKKAHEVALADLAKVQAEADKVPDLVEQLKASQQQTATAKAQADKGAADLKTAQQQGVAQATQQADEIAKLKAAYATERAQLKASGEATQRDYQALKVAHEKALSDLATAQAKADQVPKLEAKIAQQETVIGNLLIKEDVVHKHRASQAQEIAQLKAEIDRLNQQYRLDREAMKATGEAKQADYTALKKAHAEQVNGLEKDLETQITQQAAAFDTQKADAMAVIKPLREEVKTMKTKITQLETDKLEADKTRFADMAKAYQDGKDAGIAAHLIVPGAAPAPSNKPEVRTPAPMPSEATKTAVEPPKQQQAPTPLPKPEKSLVGRFAASWGAMLDWIKGKGGTFEPINTQQSGHFGPVVQLDDLHCVQSTGRGKHVIHQLDRLDKLPALDDPKMEIKYQDGVGQVKGQGLGKGGIGD